MAWLCVSVGFIRKKKVMLTVKFSINGGQSSAKLMFIFVLSIAVHFE